MGASRSCLSGSLPFISSKYWTSKSPSKPHKLPRIANIEQVSTRLRALWKVLMGTRLSKTQAPISNSQILAPWGTIPAAVAVQDSSQVQQGPKFCCCKPEEEKGWKRERKPPQTGRQILGASKRCIYRRIMSASQQTPCEWVFPVANRACALCSTWNQGICSALWEVRQVSCWELPKALSHS